MNRSNPEAYKAFLSIQGGQERAKKDGAQADAVAAQRQAEAEKRRQDGLPASMIENLTQKENESPPLELKDWAEPAASSMEESHNHDKAA